MATAHRVESVVEDDGKLTLAQLPFPAGQAVEVIVVPISTPNAAPPQSLQGLVTRYDDPTAAVAEEDWSVLR